MKKRITLLVLLFMLLLMTIVETFTVISNHKEIENTKTALSSGENTTLEKGKENSNIATNYNATQEKEKIVIAEIPELLKNFKSQIKTSSGEGYLADICLPEPNKYNQIKGITTFRGNNYRDTAAYGYVDISENKLQKVWTNVIGQTDSWTGVGWNGQPSIVEWDETIKKQMNIYDQFKGKENFVEVIYGTLDSYVHFYDLETGYPSRDPIKVESSIKGSITVDPRGYPLLYVGQGINAVSGEYVRFGYHIFSLIDGKELYFINGRDKFAYIGWGAFDGNPLIDAKSDTLILPGENGLIYVAKLNTNYDTLNGTISINPEVTKYRYTKNGYAGGMENSIAIYNNYAFFLNNNGVLQALDLNTLSPLWAYQMEDDCDATLGLEEENNTIMIYAACEVDRRKTASPAFAKKIDGKTGKVIWEYSCVVCQYDANVNGGALSSPIIGKNDISDLVIFNFSKTTSLRAGKMVALNKSNGNVVWEKDLKFYSWSSPVACYTKEGKSYIVFGDSNGQLHLIDGKTGETLYTLQTGGGNMEGSPAIYNNQIVIGTRGKRIYRIDIK